MYTLYIELIFFFLILGVLIDFISIPVTVGFTSATSVIIAVSQLKGLLGLKFESESFLDCLLKVYQNIDKFNHNDTILGVASIIILLLLRVNNSCSTLRSVSFLSMILMIGFLESERH